MRRLELLQAPADVRRLAVVVVDRRVGQPLLQVDVGALELLDELFDPGHLPMVAGSRWRDMRAGPQSGRLQGSLRAQDPRERILSCAD